MKERSHIAAEIRESRTLYASLSDSQSMRQYISRACLSSPYRPYLSSQIRQQRLSRIHVVSTCRVQARDPAHQSKTPQLYALLLFFFVTSLAFVLFFCSWKSLVQKVHSRTASQFSALKDGRENARRRYGPTGAKDRVRQVHPFLLQCDHVGK